MNHAMLKQIASEIRKNIPYKGVVHNPIIQFVNSKIMSKFSLRGNKKEKYGYRMALCMTITNYKIPLDCNNIIILLLPNDVYIRQNTLNNISQEYDIRLQSNTEKLIRDAVEIYVNFAM